MSRDDFIVYKYRMSPRESNEYSHSSGVLAHEIPADFTAIRPLLVI
ncbi:MAG: hypothetical protein ACXVB1_14865 [Pseudobdellovibrionaceae bacterium]